MKKAILLTLCMTMLLTGCTFGSDFTEDTTDTSWAISCEQFDGVKTMVVTPDESRDAVFTVMIVTESGSISVSITGADGTQYYTGNELPASSFGVEAGQNAPYTIRVETERYSGGFSVSWKATN